MNKLALFILVVSTAFDNFSTNAYKLGGCPEIIHTCRNLKIDQLSGKWYEQFRYDNSYERNAKCQTTDIAVHNGNINLTNTQLDNEKETVKTTSLTGVYNPDYSHMVFRYPELDYEFDLVILGTDYTNYIALYQCTNLYILHIENAWILTRTRFPSPEILMMAKSKFSDRNLETDTLIKTEQFWCPIFH